MLANIYLHYVFDLWVDVWRAKCAQGDVVVVRTATASVRRRNALIGPIRDDNQNR
jgi:hypothetical protein